MAELEELSDELIDELVALKGMPKEDLLYLKTQGFKYSRDRESFTKPPEINLFSSLKRKKKKKFGSIR